MSFGISFLAARRAIAATVLAVLSVTAASAATISVTGVNGAWTSTGPGNTFAMNGVGTSDIEWGKAQKSGGKKSGYSFDGAVAQEVQLDTAFTLGTFTHNNFVIIDPRNGMAGSITSATLEVKFDLLIDGTARQLTQVFEFTHWETDNKGKPCADGGSVKGGGVNRNGCADRVEVRRNPTTSGSLTVGDTTYTIDITGFLGIPLANGVPTFWTVERLANAAQLQGVITARTAPVPLPASALLLAGAFGGLVAFRRRRRV